MKTDLYTKAVLTFIAFWLGWLCLIGGPAPAQAQSNGQVIISGWYDSEQRKVRPLPLPTRQGNIPMLDR